jgi:hypothetical protein
MNFKMESIFETYNDLIRIFIFNAFFIFLILSIISIFKKNLIEYKYLKIFAFILIFIGVFDFALYIINENFNYERMTGKYGIFYILMLVFHCFFPLILLIPKIQIKIVSFLIVLFLMQMGRFFELIVILTTSFHRDYLP